MPNSQNMFDPKTAAMVPMVLDLWVNNKFTWKCWHFYFSHFSNRPNDELYDWHVHCRTVTLVGQWTGYGQDVSNNTFNFWSLFTAFLAHYPFPFFSHVPFWWKEWKRVLVTDPFNAWPSLTGDKVHLWRHNTSWTLTTPSSQLGPFSDKAATTK